MALGHAVEEMLLILLLVAGIGNFLPILAVKTGVGLAGGTLLILLSRQNQPQAAFVWKTGKKTRKWKKIMNDRCAVLLGKSTENRKPELSLGMGIS